MGCGISVQLLGPPAVVIGAERHPVNGVRQQAVLALLALRAGDAVTIEYLIDGLWGDDPPNAAIKTARAYISRLRPLLGDALVSTGRTYTLQLEPVCVDALALGIAAVHGRDLLDDGDADSAAARLRAVVENGSPDLDPALFGLPGLSAWRARIEEDGMRATEVFLAAELAAGRAGALIPRLEQLVADHPYREHLWAALMRCLYASGRQGDALAAYQRARRTLATELGVEPGAELRQLELAILRQEPDVAAAGRASSMPTYRTSFVGREDEVEQLRKLQATAQLVTVVGPGGVGKTRLVAESLAGDRDAGDRPVHFVDLSPLRVDDLEQVTMMAARAVGAEEGVGPVLAAVARALHPPETVLVLDNCEQVANTAAQLADQLLTACPDLCIVATSRVRLRVDGEVVLRLDPLPPDPDAAVRLFADRATAAQPAFDLDDNLPAVVRLVTRLDGVPLALEMAAARLTSLSVVDLAARLDDRVEHLAAAARSAPERHASLEATVAWSYDLLSPDAQRLLRWLAVFHGGWTLPAVTAVTAGVAVVPGGTDPVPRLDELVSASLVELGGRGDPGRYRLLDTVRDFAWQRLVASGDADAAQCAHAEWVLELAEANETELFAAGVESHSRVLDRERDNVAAAVAWALDHDERIGPHLVAALAWWWQLRGAVEPARQLLERALHIERGPTLIRARLLRRFGALASHMDASEESLAVLTEAEALAAQLDAPALRAAALHNLGYTHRTRNEVDAARAAVTEALPLWEELRLTHALALSIGLLADIATSAGDFDEAAARYAEGLELMRRSGSRHGAVAFLHSMAELAIHRGRLDDAADLIARALPMAEEVGDAFHIGILHQAAGHLALRRGQRREAADELCVAIDQLWGEQTNLEMALTTADIVSLLAADAGRVTEALVLMDAVDGARAAARLARPANYEVMVADARRRLEDAVATDRTRPSVTASTWSIGEVIDHARRVAASIASAGS